MAEPQILSSKHYPYTHSRYAPRSAHSPRVAAIASPNATHAIRPCPRHHRPRRNRFLLGLGSNLPLSPKSHPIDCLERLFAWLYRHPQIAILQASPIYRNPPFGFTAQGDFYNALLLCESDMGLREVFGLMFYAERRFGRGRKRAFKNAPRTLDIDLIFFNDMRVNLPSLQLPHRFYKDRASVLVPLSFMEI